MTYNLYLIRHAQSFSNIGEFSSSEDTDITDIGKVQAKRVAKYLIRKDVDLIISSPYKRAIRTLEEIRSLGYGSKIIVDDLLRERSKGIYKGLPKKEWKEAIKKSGLDEYSFRPEQGENYEDVYNRMKVFWNKLKKYYREKHYKNIAIISHNACIVNLILVILELPWQEAYYFGVKNASISWFKFDASLRVIDFEINTMGHILRER